MTEGQGQVRSIRPVERRDPYRVRRKTKSSKRVREERLYDGWSRFPEWSGGRLGGTDGQRKGQEVESKQKEVLGTVVHRMRYR